jgi:AcrR family transcriptional regulator
MPNKSDLRSKIILAAIELIAESGLSKLSFDNLVKATSVSKGGILYHFANKDVLLVSILTHIEQVFIDGYKGMLGVQSPHPGRAVQAYLRSALESHLDPRLYAALAAISAERSDLLSKQNSLYRMLRQDIQADGDNFARQWVLVAALDSLWLDYTNHLYGLQKAEHAELGKFLLSEARAIVEAKQ